MKYFLFLTLFTVVLFSRENPFFPLEGEDDELPLVSNIVEHFNPLNTQEIILPDSARVLKKVILTYQNLDGSIENRELQLNSSLDWHLPVKIYQGEDKSIKLTSKMLTKVSRKKVSKIKKSVVQKKKSKAKYKKVYQYKFVEFYQMGRFMQIATKDDLIRKFILVNPHRVVLDFKRDALFLTKLKKLSGKFYKEIRLGNHDGYYRVVLELDGKYRYKLAKKPYGYLVEIY